MDRVKKLKLILWFLTGIGLAVGFTRMIFGLGATTNLTDAVPWGFWIGFDVMSGVALAAGGFVVCAIVYIFGGEKYHDIVKPAVLTAFLGYVAVVLGLLFDLGLPWNIWHMIIYWNPHSPLFEVGWCVMLYTTVLLLEFSPVPLEEFSRWAKIRGVMMKLRIPLVITGIALSTLHQSSLGSLFLIMPYRVAPLWYTAILPILFFLSAIMLGLYMAMFESHATAYFYRRKPETELLKGFGRGTIWVAVIYLIVRFGDLIIRGQAGELFAAKPMTYWFWFEILMIAVIPAILFALPQGGKVRSVQWTAAFCGVFGVVLNRINVGGVAHLNGGLGSYLPAWSEFAISAGVVAIIGLVFLFVIEKFKVWEKRPSDPFAAPDTLPEFDHAAKVSLGTPEVFGRRINSLVFVTAVAFGFALIYGSEIYSKGVENTPVNPARGGDSLMIDGNLDGYGVVFPHQAHINRIGSNQESCVICHHMNLPFDKQSECSSCHRQMYQPADAFKHDWHSSPEGANLSCFDCHEADKAKTKLTAADCNKCHNDLVPANATIKIEQYMAPGYVDALHMTCINCHTANVDTIALANLDQCSTCHAGSDIEDLSINSEYSVKTYSAGKYQITPMMQNKQGK